MSETLVATQAQRVQSKRKKTLNLKAWRRRRKKILSPKVMVIHINDDRHNIKNFKKVLRHYTADLSELNRKVLRR